MVERKVEPRAASRVENWVDQWGHRLVGPRVARKAEKTVVQ
jgi:hypothetical protein